MADIVSLLHLVEMECRLSPIKLGSVLVNLQASNFLAVCFQSDGLDLPRIK